MAAILNGRKPKLEYLFVAHFYDGTSIYQTAEDTSGVDPTKSAFYDVLQRLSEVRLFGIHNDDHAWAVDLTNGKFSVDNVQFRAFPNWRLGEIPEGGKYQLVYCRDCKQVFTSEGPVGEIEVAYRIGWEYHFEGKIWTQTIVVGGEE